MPDAGCFNLLEPKVRDAGFPMPDACFISHNSLCDLQRDFDNNKPGKITIQFDVCNILLTLE